MDVLWSDVSEFQTVVTDAYPYEVLAIRSNDGTYKDTNFAANYAWAREALISGKLKALIIYMVYRENWQDGLATIKTCAHPPHGKAAMMIDVESWGGEITGNQSAGINGLFAGLAEWVGDARRIIGYGNTSDLNTLWPSKPPGMRLIIAGYGTNPNYVGKLGHQFTDGTSGGALQVPPFGFADVNSADGYDIDAFCAALGLTSTPSPEVLDMPAGVIPSGPQVTKLVMPIGRSVSALVSEGWLSLASSEDAPNCHVWIQGANGGITDTAVSLTKDRRWWMPLPDGTDQMTIQTNSAGSVGWCLELRPQ